MDAVIESKLRVKKQSLTMTPEQQRRISKLQAQLKLLEKGWQEAIDNHLPEDDWRRKTEAKRRELEQAKREDTPSAACSSTTGPSSGATTPFPSSTTVGTYQRRHASSP